MEEGGGFSGTGYQQGYYESGQQTNQGAFFGQDQQGHGNLAGAEQQQQLGGGQMGLFGQQSGLQEGDSVGPFADQDMQFGDAASLQDPLLNSLSGGQHQQQQQSFATGQGDQGDAQAQMWQQAFYKLAAAAGVPADPRQGQPPEAIIEQAQAARHRDPWVQAQARDAAMQVQAAVLTAQNINLRRELGSGWAAADSNVIQVQQLILDPAIENEFKQLREQLALRVAETEAAKAAYEGQAFTQESKNGHALLRKVKVLTDENEDLGRQQREGVQAAQAAIAAVERHHADELREEVQELRDLCNFYQQENEELTMVTGLYQRQIEEIKQKLETVPPPVPDRDYGRDAAPISRDKADVRSFERGSDRDRDRPLPPPRDRAPAARDRERGPDRPRDRTAERRDRENERPPPREREREYDMNRSSAGGRGGGRYDGGRGGYDGGRGGRGGFRGRGRNIAGQYAGQKRPR